MYVSRFGQLVISISLLFFFFFSFLSPNLHIVPDMCLMKSKCRTFLSTTHVFSWAPAFKEKSMINRNALLAFMAMPKAVYCQYSSFCLPYYFILTSALCFFGLSWCTWWCALSQKGLPKLRHLQSWRGDTVAFYTLVHAIAGDENANLWNWALKWNLTSAKLLCRRVHEQDRPDFAETMRRWNHSARLRCSWVPSTC